TERKKSRLQSRLFRFNVNDMVRSPAPASGQEPRLDKPFPVLRRGAWPHDYPRLATAGRTTVGGGIQETGEESRRIVLAVVTDVGTGHIRGGAAPCGI